MDRAELNIMLGTQDQSIDGQNLSDPALGVFKVAALDTGLEDRINDADFASLHLQYDFDLAMLSISSSYI